MLELQDGTKKSDKQFSYSLESVSNQPTRWLILCWNTFGARTSHGQLQTHKTSHHLPPYSILCTSPRGLHPNGFLSRDSRRGVLKLLRLELPPLCGAITSCSNLQSGRGLKQSCSSCQGLSNSVSHTTCMHETRVDSRHFMVGSQIASLIPGLSFCHNLCCRCPNVTRPQVPC